MALGHPATLSIPVTNWIPLDLYIQKHVSYRNTQSDPAHVSDRKKCITLSRLVLPRQDMKSTQNTGTIGFDECWIDLINEWYEIPEA